MPGKRPDFLRRQVLRKWRKPLILLSPKSLLRHPLVVSPLEEVAGGQFHKILGDDEVPLASCRQLMICTGKIYYELLEERAKRERTDIAIIRIEQLYPLSADELTAAIEGLPPGTDIRWVQDEPTNMGAWPYIKLNFGDMLAEKYQFSLVSRSESASPSTGSMAAHKIEQAELIEAAFAPR
ncbi:MAG: hypothetical protein ACF788_04530 [Novipirellula sp. JB048]